MERVTALEKKDKDEIATPMFPPIIGVTMALYGAATRRV